MFSSEPLYKILLVLYAFFVPIEVWANIPTRAVEVRMDKQVTINGDAIILGDVSTIYAKSIRHFQLLSSLTLSAFPGDKKELSLPHAYVANRIREILPPGTDFKLHAPDQIVFLQDRLGISPHELAEELIRRGRNEGRIPAWAEAQVDPVSGFDQLKLWKLGDVRLEPASEMARWKGEMSFKVSHPGKSDQSLVWIKVRMRWFTEAWVARRQINILAGLNPADFQKSRVEVTSLREDPVLAAEDIGEILGSARARRSIATGMPLIASTLERAPDAKPGQPLRVVFISESGVRVTTEGALIGNGSIGSEVRAKLRTSRRVVTGKLVSGGVMEITL